MKKLLLTLALTLLPSLASAQCNGVFSANTVCGRSAVEAAGTPHQISGTSIAAGLVVGTTVITGGSPSAAYKSFLTNNNGILGNGHAVDTGIGLSGNATYPNNFNVYPVNTDNGIALTYGTGAGNGEGGSVTFFTKNPAGAAPGIHQELGFMQAYAWVNGGYNFSATLAVVFGTTEAWTPTANGAGVVFQTVLRGTTVHTGELSIADGVTVMDAGDATIIVGLGRGTLNARSGIYDGANRVLSASNLTITKNQSTLTEISVVNTTNSTTAGASFKAQSDVAVVEIGSSATSFSSALFAGRSWVFTTAVPLMLGTSGANPIIFAPNSTEQARILLGLMVGTTTDPGAGIINILTGLRVNNTATSGNVLRGNGTNFISAQLACSDLSGFGTGCSAAAGITALTGDVTATGPGSAAATLATVATAGTTGSSTAIPVITINAKGLTTLITTAAVVAPAGTLTGTTLASNVVSSLLTSLGTITSLTATTINAFTLGGTISGGGQTVTNTVITNSTIGSATPLAGTFTIATANSFVPNSSTVPTNGTYLPAANTVGWAINSAAEMQLTATALSPAADGGSSLGTTALGWQNLFGNTGFVLNIEGGDWVATHTTGILTVGTGDLRVTTAGANAASVVTVGGAQILTGKSIAVTQLSGTLQAGQFPALTGDTTTSAGSLATTTVGINGVNQTTGWTTFTPAITCGTGAVAGYTTQAGRYKLLGKTAFVSINIVPSGIGTCVGTQTVTGLPFTTGSNPQDLFGRDGTAGSILVIPYAAGSTSGFAVTYSNGNPTAGAPLVFTGLLETN